MLDTVIILPVIALGIAIALLGVRCFSQGAKTMPRERVTLTSSSPFLCLAFSPEGKLLAAGQQDGTVKLWDAATAGESATLRGHASSVLCLVFSPDGRTLASGSSDKTVKLWDVTAKRELATLGDHEAWVEAIAFHPNGKTLATAIGSTTKTGGIVRFWDLATKQGRTVFEEEKSKYIKRHPGFVGALSFSPDGKTLAIGIFDSVVLWDLETEKERTAMQGYSTVVKPLAFARDGQILAEGVGRSVKLWDPVTAGELVSIPGQLPSPSIRSITVSKDGRRLAIGISQGVHQTSYIRMWDLVANKEFGEFACHDDMLTGVAWSPDGNTLATAAYDRPSGVIKIWDLATVLKNAGK